MGKLPPCTSCQEALIASPDDTAAIINAAIDSGIPADQVVTAALIAGSDEDSAKIIQAAKDAAPGQEKAIDLAASNLKQEINQSLVANATAIKANVPKGTGGGAAAPASVVEELVKIIASISNGAPT